ncbi:MAG: hypothetical protein DYG88_00295 [Chloroflexi bacterium CFX4]|nr:hypothetical protein [Chloroflexi bacterium CFX4]MDL1921662.1 hypothetical protein [Chloroflexi bacterium CFX3]
MKGCVPIQIEPNVDERILVLRYQMPLSGAENVVQAIADFATEVRSTFFAVSDLRGIPITFDAMVDGLDMVRRSLAQVPMRFVTIGDSELVEMGNRAIPQKQCGGCEAARALATEEEALAYCRSELQKSD